MSEKYQMMAPDDIRDCCDRIGRLRTLLTYYIVMQTIALVLLFISFFAEYFDVEFLMKFVNFIDKNDTITMIITIVSSGVAFLYYAELMCLNRLDNNLLVAGVLGIVAFLYSGSATSMLGVNSTAYITAIYKTYFSKAIIALIMAVVFRKTYYSAMSSRTWPLSEKVSSLWKRLWSFTLKMYVGTTIVLVAIKLIMDHIIKDAGSKQYSFDLKTTVTILACLLLVIIVAASILEIVMQCRERKCLGETSECLFSLPPTSEKSE